MAETAPSWVNDYVGLPFEQYNCWQLLRKVYAEQFDINLPDLDDQYKDPKDAENIKRLYEREMNGRTGESGTGKGWQKIDNPEFGCAVVLKIQGQPWHCGIVISDNLMLHTEYKINACVERFSSIIWHDRIIGFYHYVR